MRPPLFPRDRGLALRMVLAAVVTPLVVLAGLAAIVLLAPIRVDIFVGIAIVVGVVMAVRDRERARAARGGTYGHPELEATVTRLCLAADLPKPEVVVSSQRQPNSWIVWTGGGHYRLHVTKGLLDALQPSELEAVVAHELAHVAHRDAAVMTAVGGPGAVLLSGGLRMARGWWPMIAGGLVAAGLGWLGSLGGRVLSRYREFAADAGAVALTGNPAALASALTKVSNGLVAIPSRDLRAAAAMDAFHLLPVARGGRLGLPDTHPPLSARIERLQRLEAALQSARGPSFRE
jgi:heat shock protein HtpX